MPTVPCISNLAFICLERKIVIVIVSVLDLCMSDFSKNVYCNTFHRFQLTENN